MHTSYWSYRRMKSQRACRTSTVWFQLKSRTAKQTRAPPFSPDIHATWAVWRHEPREPMHELHGHVQQAFPKRIAGGNRMECRWLSRVQAATPFPTTRRQRRDATRSMVANNCSQRRIGQFLGGALQRVIVGKMRVPYER